jgi:hypothetical protein
LDNLTKKLSSLKRKGWPKNVSVQPSEKG